MTNTLYRRVVAALVATALACLGALTVDPPGARAASGSTLTVDTSEITTLNPFLAYYSSEVNALAVTYPTLVWPNEKATPSPYLADSWSVSADKLTWTFRLHQGLKWSDGTPITAQDVAWTFNLVMTNSTAATANGSLVQNFASVTAPDANTVQIKTKTPQANMLYVVGLPIVPEHIWKSKVSGLGNFKNTDMPVVGYGPYRFTGYKPDQYVTLSADKNFFQGAPHYDTLILQYFKNTDAAVAALRSGQIDQVNALTATEYQALEKDNSLVTNQQVGSRWTGVEVNPGARSRSGKKLGTGNPILGDTRVRTAIAMGIDRAALVQKVLNGLGQVGSGYLPPAFPQWTWQPSASEKIGYDPAAANRLLDRAGYPKGADGIRHDAKTGKPLSFRLGIHSDSITDSQISSYLVGWMKAIGIKLTIQSQSMSALNENLAKGDWDLLMDGWGSGADPTYLLSIQTCGVLPKDDGSDGNTDSFFCNKTYDKLFDEQQREFDTAKRVALVQQMQKILYAANDDIILYYQNNLAAVRKQASKGYLYGSPNSQGFYPYQVVWRAWMTAQPPASSSASGSTSSSGASTGVVVGIVVGVVVIVLVAGGLVMRRRATATDRE